MLTILQGDAWEKLLLEFPSESVQCCVTSPPYWGLRDYGTATWEGGFKECSHIDASYEGTRISNSPIQLGSTGSYSIQYRNVCGKCGAKRIDSQIGLEETPEQYVTKMVEVFREVRRVLKKDGTLWMNLGDSFVGGNNTNNGGNANFGSQPGRDGMGETAKSKWTGLRPKNLCGIPWRVAFALQADGWYLRSDIIWAKPNPMPESVTDRPTRAHEYLFLLSKNERYYYDAEAIREANQLSDTGWVKSRRRLNEIHGNGQTAQGVIGTVGLTDLESGRNKRSVWTVPTEPYAEAHFATFPPDLIKPCILAGTKPGDLVLDPFAGSGTTGAVAIELGRKAILIELNPAYIPLIKKRCAITPGFQFTNPNGDLKPPEIAQFHELL
jgi:DNA modification methylase